MYTGSMYPVYILCNHAVQQTAKPVEGNIMDKPWNKKHNSQREDLTAVILEGLQRMHVFDTYGELFRATDEVLDTVTFKDENKGGA